MKKRIAIWTHGGIGSGMYSQGQPCIHRLIKRLAEQYVIDVYTQLSPKPDFLADGFSFFSARANIRSGTLRWISLVFIFAFNHWKQSYHVLYGFWGYPAGVVVTLLGKIFRMPSVIHLQGGDAAYVPSLSYGVFDHPIRRRLCIWAYSRCNVLIALTQYQLLFLREFGIARAVQIIPYGVDTKLFTYQPARSELRGVRFLYVGNQTPVKDQGTLLRALALIVRKMPATLTVVGVDHDHGSVRRLCRELEIENLVSFLGPQPYEKLPGYYHESDVLMLTSIHEGQGLVITEAAACGTLLAGTCVGLLADMGDKCGIVAPIGDAEALAAQIISVLRSPSVVNAKKEAARAWAMEKNEDFTVRRIAEELDKLVGIYR